MADGFETGLRQHRLDARQAGLSNLHHHAQLFGEQRGERILTETRDIAA
jgi:hypothetical protein